ncbi:MAG: hemerythrin domain-containing protein [Thaumarchaeota archaeon]|nr:hemerythrin domain-containing protein [Nitrososphaerota archaeon]
MSILAGEHKVMLSMLHEIEKDLDSIKGGTLNANTHDRITTLVGFLQTHFTKEEQVVFPILSRYLGIDRAVVDAVSAEHERITTDFVQLSKPPSAQFEKIQKTIRMLKSHISKEDNVLFWLAEIKIPPHLYGILVKQMSSLETGQTLIPK